MTESYESADAAVRGLERLAWKAARTLEGRARYLAPTICIDDLVQAGRVGVWEAWSKPSPDHHFTLHAWITARTRIMDEVRRHMPFGRNGPINTEEFDSNRFDEAEEVFDLADDMDRVMDSVDALAPYQRAVVNGRLQGYSYPEIVEHFGGTIKSASSTYYDAVRRLKGMLKQ